VKRWHELIGDPTLADAIFRPVHANIAPPGRQGQLQVPSKGEE